MADWVITILTIIVAFIAPLTINLAIEVNELKKRLEELERSLDNRRQSEVGGGEREEA